MTDLLAAAQGRWRLVTTAVLLMTAAGLLSWATMPREEDPQFPNRNGLIVASFPGADTETMERLVAEPIEDHLAEVETVWHVNTTIRAGRVIVHVELEDDVYDTEAAWEEVEEALEKAHAEFPEGVSAPRLDDDLVSQEAVVLAVTGSFDTQRLSRAAHEVRRELLGLAEVKEVRLIADVGEQITIELEAATARRLAMNPAALGESLSRRSDILPGGWIHLGSKMTVLRPETGYHSLEEIESTAVLLPSGTSAPLDEVARIRFGPREPAHERMRFRGRPAVGLAVVPKDSIDRVEFGRRVRERVAAAAGAVAPLEIEEVAFQPDHVAARLDGLTRSLRWSILIVAGVLVLTMGPRMGITVAVVVPVVALIGFGLFAATGGILHQVSIAALVISLGMLVDNAIVMVENIQWRVDRGEPGRQAALRSSRELALPLGTATGTTLAAFVPMLLATGTTADFMQSLPIVVMITLSVSYLFALVATPPLAARVLRPRKRARRDRSERLAGVVSRLAVKRPLAVLAVTAVLILISLVLVGRINRKFFAPADRNIVLVDLQLPVGTHLDDTDRAADRVEQWLEREPTVVGVATFVGRTAPKFYYNLRTQTDIPHRAQLFAETTSLEAVEEILQRVREFAHVELPEAEVTARRLEQGPVIEAPLVVRILGSNLEELAVAAEAILAEVRRDSGTRDVRHTLDQGIPGIVVRIDDAAAERHGLTRSDVAATLFAGTLGVEIGQFWGSYDPVPILLRSREGVDLTVADLETLVVTPSTGGPVPLAQIARFETEWREAAIYHRDRDRVVQVLAQVTRETSAAQVVDRLTPRLAEIALPPGVRYEFAGEVEESGQANTALLRAMPFGLFLLLFFLLAEFNSFRQVGIILVTVPLAVIGIFPGLLLAGQPLGFMAMLGVISLVGIVVNNAIVLLDVLASRRAEGAGLEEAIRAAIGRRTRPILLTTATTIAGLLPLAYADSLLWPPLAWAMISGLLAATILTLLVVPALYKILYSRSAGRGRERAAGAAAALVLTCLLAAPAPIAAAEGPPRITLEEAMTRARSRPRAEAAAARALAATKTAASVRRQARLPTLRAQIEGDARDRDFEFETPLGRLTLGDRTSGLGVLSLSQPLFDPARLLYGGGAARQEAVAAELRARRAQELLAAEAGERFLDLLALDARLDSTRRLVASLEARLAETRERVARGRVLEADALRVRLELESAELEELELLEARRLGALALGHAVGHDGPVEADPGTAFAPEAAPAPTDLESAVGGRADVRALESRLEALRLEIGAVRAERLPQLDLQIDWIFSDGSPFRPDELVEGALRATWTPFRSGTRGPRVAALEAERAALEADLVELRRRVSEEIEGALAEGAIARAAIEVGERGVALATETLRVERERHAAGRATTGDLLDAEAELHLRRSARALAHIDSVRARVRLDLAVGGLSER